MRHQPPRRPRSDGMLARIDRAAGHMNPFLVLIAIGLLVLNVLAFALMAPTLGRRWSGGGLPTGSALVGPDPRLAGLQ